MKKVIKYSAILAIFALAAACAKETVNQFDHPESLFYIHAISSDSKVSMDEDGVKVIWTTGDKIKVNNHNSIALTQDDNHGTYASFAFTEQEKPQAPYYAVYNADRAYGFGELGDHTYKLSLDYNSYTQAWVEGSFDKQYAVLYGTGEDENIQFHHAMSYIKVTPTLGTDDVKIAKIMVIARGEEALSGRFKIDLDNNGAMTPYRDTRKYVTMAGPAEGVDLGKSFMIAIPAGSYASGLTIRVVDVNGKMMEKNTKGFTAVAGTVYPVSTVYANLVDYVPLPVTEIELVQVDRTFATIKWNNIASSIGEKSTYILQVYTDEACTQPVYSQDVITYDAPFSRYSPFGASKYVGQNNGSNVAPTELKISCGLLQPDTDYWFRVKPIDGTIVVDGAKTKTGSGSTSFSNTAAGAPWSAPFHFKTAPARVPAPNEVIYTGFDALSIGPNMENLSAGVAPQFTWETGLPATADAKPERYAFLTDFAAGNYSKGWCTWACDRCNQAQGSTFGSVVSWWGFCDDSDALYLDGTTKNVKLNGSTARYNRLGKVGDITGWYLSSQTFPGMGHVFMNDVGNFVGTPALTTNLTDAATPCTVRIKAAKVRNNGDANDITIKAYKFDGSTLNTTTPVETIVIGGKSCYKTWTAANNYTTDFTTRDYSFDIDLKSGEALVFAVSSFAIIDEIQIVKK